MDFSHVNQGSRKSGRFVMVAALHVALGIMFVQGMNVRNLVKTHESIIDVIPTEEIKQVTPPPPEEVVKVQKRELPPVVIPTVEHAIVDPVLPTITTVDRKADEHPVVGPVGPGPDKVDEPVKPAQPPAMRNAVLANANACALPAYPKSALMNEEEGTTTLALMVGADGRVSAARVEQSSGFRELDRAAVSALSLCQFKPASTNGVPEAGWAKLAYVWKLN